MRWIVLDAWGVTYTVSDDVNTLLVPFLQTRWPELSASRISEAYARASLGQITARQFWAELGLEGQYPEIEAEYLSTRPALDDGFRSAAEALAGQHHLAMLSNDIADWSAYLRQRFEIEPMFDLAVISGAVGVRKPEPGIYKLLLQRSGASPDDCVLVDDRPRNLRAAAQAGWRTIHFRREEFDDSFDADGAVDSFDQLPGAVENVWG